MSHHIYWLSNDVFVAQRHCIKTKGITYDGKVSVTHKDVECQRWDSHHPHTHKYTNTSQFPDATLADAANYCRAPDGRDIPWCYTISAERRWDYCDFEEIYWGMKTSVSFTMMVGFSHLRLQNRVVSLGKSLMQNILSTIVSNKTKLLGLLYPLSLQK